MWPVYFYIPAMVFWFRKSHYNGYSRRTHYIYIIWRSNSFLWVFYHSIHLMVCLYIFFFACVYLFFKGTNSEFFKFALSLMLGMSISLLICMIYPNGLNLRPETLPNNLCGKLVGMIYASDTPTNVFPSIHVYNSLAVHIAIHRCQALQKHRWVSVSSLILCILICMSTVFLKQHSVIDVLGGTILMIILYIFIYVLDYSKIFKKAHQKESDKPINQW